MNTILFTARVYRSLDIGQSHDSD